MMKYILLLFVFVGCLKAQFEDAPLYQPFNLNLENATVGYLPTKWSLPDESEQKGYTATATNINPQSGKYCLELRFESDSNYFDGIHGSSLQVFNAEPYHGKKIKISGYVKADVSNEDYAGLYVSERTFNNEYPFIYANQDSPIKTKNWTYCSTEFTVSDNAYSINMGLILFGKGTAWLDNVKIEVLDQVEKIESPSGLSPVAKENLLNFSKIYGYTKFFHPSDEVEYYDDETYLYHSIKKIEKANNATDANEILSDRLKRLAPSAKLINNDIALIIEKPKNAEDRFAIAKVTSNIYFENGNLNSGTKRLNIYNSRMPREASIYQIISAKNFRNKKITYSTYAKTLPYGKDMHAELWFRIDFEDQSKESINKKMDEIILSDNWKKYSMSVDIPDDALQIRTGLVMLGEGKVLFDSVNISQVKKSNLMIFPVRNNSFDMRWKLNDIQYWKIPKSSVTSGYTYSINSTDESLDGNSLEISTKKDDYIKVADLNDVCTLKIDDNLFLHLPLTLYDSGGYTLPKFDGNPEETITMNPKDRITKIAVFIEMWNFMKFYSALDFPENKWDELFLEYVSLVAKTNSVEEFDNKMLEFLRITNNVRSDFWRTQQADDFTLPFILDFDNGNAIVVKSFDKKIEKGDRIVDISGINIEKYINDRIDKLPGNSMIWKQKRLIFPILQGEFKSEEEIKLLRNNDQKIVNVARNLTNREVFINRPYTIEWLDTNTIYVDATRLNDFEFSKLMERFSSAKGIVFDLRGDALLSEHFLGFFTDKDLESYDWELRKYYNPCEPPQITNIDGVVLSKESKLTDNVVFITNESTVGKSETILNLVKDYKIGKIIGESTVGSYDTMQEIHLPCLYNFSFDIYPMSYKGNSDIKFKKIEPDIIVKDKNDYPNDKKIQKAIEILKENY